MLSLPLTLPAGSDLKVSLENFVREENKEGFILGVVGNLSRATFQCPGKAAPTVLEGNLEIITLNGTLSEQGVHLHLSLSDGDCKVWGGHLEVGSTVLKGADVLVGLLDTSEVNTKQQHSPDSLTKQTSPRIEIFVLPGCPWSARATRMLRTLGLPHIVNTINDDVNFQLVKERSNFSTFPQIFIDGEFIGGYEALAEIHASGQLQSFK